MRITGLLFAGIAGLVIVQAGAGQAPTSALRGLSTPAGISTKTVNTQGAMRPPNTISPLQTPIRSKPPSFSTLPRVSLMTWPPRFSTTSILPRISNPFQPKAPQGINPFTAPKKVISPPKK